MWDKIKTVSEILFWAMSAIIIAIMCYVIGLALIIPVILYIAYKIYQIRQEVKSMEQPDEHTKVNYTKN